MRTLFIRIETHKFHIGAVRCGFRRYSFLVRFSQMVIVVFDYDPHFKNFYDLAHKLWRVRATTKNIRVLPVKRPIMTTRNRFLDKVRVNTFTVAPVPDEITQH